MISLEQHLISNAGERLDRHLLRLYPWLDRTLLGELIAQGQISLNGRTAKKGVRLAAGDRIEVRDIPEPEDMRLQPNPKLPLTVLHEDESLLALDKPAGQPTHPLRWTERHTLVNALLARYPELADIGGDRRIPALLHRLDTQTSGLVLVAKTPAAYASLRSQFRRLSVEKHYTALVHGCVDTPGRLEAPLTHQTKSPCRMAVVNHPARPANSACFPAATSWVPIQSRSDYSLLDVTIFTGVTHQIRCHLAFSGHPIAGDTLYGAPALPATYSLSPAASPSPAPRHWLHASRILFTHPATGRPLDLACPLPPDWPSIGTLPGHR